MRHQQWEEYIEIVQGCQQFRLILFPEMEIEVKKNEFYRQITALLRELNYCRLRDDHTNLAITVSPFVAA